MVSPELEWRAIPASLPRILVVEDDPAVLALLRRALTPHYQVFACSRGDEALTILREEECSLVITDLRLPGGSGLEILEAAGELHRSPGVIIITGYASLDSAIRATNDGALAYITKPFKIDYLLSYVAKVLAQWETSLYASGLQKRIQKLLALNQASRGIGRATSLQEVLRRTLQATVQLADTRRGVILLLEEDHSSVFPPAEPLEAWQLDAEQGAGGRALVDHRPGVVADARQDSLISAELQRLGVESCVVVPLISGGEPGGLLYAVNPHPTNFSQDQVEILSVLASQTAVAIENVQLFTQLQQAYDQLQELDRLKDEFIALVSHELRTPLHSIGGFIELLLGDKIRDPATRRDCLIRVAGQTEHLRRLVEELLDLSRIEAGRLTMDRMPLSLGPVIEEVVTNLRGLAREKGLTLQVASLPTLPLVEGDSRRLGEVITNLVHNAIKFTPAAGQVTVAAEVKGGEVVIRVTDTGVGIPPEALPRLFERFHQVGSPSRHHEGMGIGLYISKGIVEAHGGRIWVKSELGQGSTFYVALPFLAADSAGSHHHEKDIRTG